MYKATDELDRVQLSMGEHVMLTPEAFKRLRADLESYAQNGKPLGGFYEIYFELDMKVDAFLTFSSGTILLMEKRFKYADTPD
jgi:hypothetical protein